MPEAESSSVGWVDLAVVPLVAILAVPTLLWFGDHPWAVLGKDAPRYLFAGSELVSGGGLDSLAGTANYNGGHGPVSPALIGSLILCPRRVVAREGQHRELVTNEFSKVVPLAASSRRLG